MRQTHHLDTTHETMNWAATVSAVASFLATAVRILGALLSLARSGAITPQSSALLVAIVVLAPREACAQCIPDTLLATIPNPSPAFIEEFGESVATNGNLIVVGSCRDDDGGVTKAGAAHLFDARTGSLVQTLRSPSPRTLGLFGTSISIHDSLVIAGELSSRSAYIFDANTGSLVSTLKNPSSNASNEFGYPVSISGNLATVGAIGADPSGVKGAGTAYVFNAKTGVLKATLMNPDPSEMDLFGYSISLSGDFVIVGAPRNDPNDIADAGSAYVFDATTGTLMASLHNPAPGVEDKFGRSVAISDGLALVGALWDDPDGVNDAGSAYVFEAMTGRRVAVLSNPSSNKHLVKDNWFGTSVAISGNVAIVGSRGLGGAAYVFDARSGAHNRTLRSPRPVRFDSLGHSMMFDEFGRSVAIFGSLAVVGALGVDVSGVSYAGAVYSFSCDSP